MVRNCEFCEFFFTNEEKTVLREWCEENSVSQIERASSEALHKILLSNNVYVALKKRANHASVSSILTGPQGPLLGTVGSQDILLSQAGPCLSSRSLQVHPKARTGGGTRRGMGWESHPVGYCCGQLGRSSAKALGNCAKNASTFSSWLGSYLSTDSPRVEACPG